MPEAGENTTSHLLTNLKELVKTYVIHDGQGRIIAAYEAKASAQSGEPCLLTRYGYREGASTSSQVRYRIESNATWDPDDQGWDANSLTNFPLPNPVVDPATV